VFHNTDAIPVPEKLTSSIEPSRPVLAGFSRVDITPPLDRIRAFGLGYWFERSVRFRGVRDPLYVRVLVWGEGLDLQVIISADAILDTYGFIREAQRQISSRLDIPAHHVFISCTHTHSAPLIETNRTLVGAEYRPFLVDRIMEATIEAFARRQPVTASLTRGRVSGAVRNRRPLLRNGRVAELHAPLDPAEIGDAGPVNDVLTLIKFLNERGSLAGAICHFGIHGVAIQCSDLISSDCMGRAIQHFEKDSGAGIVLHLNSPCADIDPVKMGDEDALKEMTERLYAGLRRVNAEPERAISPAPQQSYGSDFRAKRRPTRTKGELSWELERIAGASNDSNRSHHSGPGYERFLLEEEQAVSELPSEFDIPYQILRTGNLLWIGVGGEVFTRTGQDLVALDDYLTILPVGITGASAGYLPTVEMFAQGGYEVACARWCPIAPGEAEKLFGTIESAVRAMAGAGHT
jgi:neutral ceramidase